MKTKTYPAHREEPDRTDAGASVDKILCQSSYHQTITSKGAGQIWHRRDDTMQRLFWLLLLTVFPASAQTSLVFRWAPNPSNAGNWPPCSKSVKRMCRTGYTLTDVTATSAPVVIISTIARRFYDLYNHSLAVGGLTYLQPGSKRKKQRAQGGPLRSCYCHSSCTVHVLQCSRRVQGDSNIDAHRLYLVRQAK